MRVLVIDVGGTHVKLMHSGSTEARKFNSGDGFTPQQVVAGTKALTADWPVDAISIGIPSPVIRGAVAGRNGALANPRSRHASTRSPRASRSRVAAPSSPPLASLARLHGCSWSTNRLASPTKPQRAARASWS